MPLGMMLGGAMIINLSCAALAGVMIPLFLQRKGIDPALAGGVLLTTTRRHHLPHLLPTL
jgi:magnesium transporter